MAAIQFTAADVRRLLGLPSAKSIDDLIKSGALPISAYTPSGRPLFDTEAVRHAAARNVAAEKIPA
jgi:hypothetical protein